MSIYIIEILNIIYFSYGGKGGTCDDGAKIVVFARMLVCRVRERGGGAGEDVQREKLRK